LQKFIASEKMSALQENKEDNILSLSDIIEMAKEKPVPRRELYQA
jgi:hypothetical protein